MQIIFAPYNIICSLLQTGKQRLSPGRARDHPVMETVPIKSLSLSLSLSLRHIQGRGLADNNICSLQIITFVPYNICSLLQTGIFKFEVLQIIVVVAQLTMLSGALLHRRMPLLRGLVGCVHICMYVVG